MKKIFLTIWAGVLLIFLCLLLTFSQNHRMIQKYEQGTVRMSMLPRFSLTQRYVLPYNKGNIHFLNEEYDQAAECYRQALLTHPGKGKECDVRVNWALSIVKPISPQSVTPDNLDENLEKLSEAISVLTENGCAAKDGSGHDSEAQILLDDILAYMEQLKRTCQMQNEEEVSDQTNGTSEEKEKEELDKEEKNQEQEKTEGEPDQEQARQMQELEDAIGDSFYEMQREGEAERRQSLEMFESWGDYSFDSGKKW